MTTVRLVPLEVGRLVADMATFLDQPGEVLMPVPSWLIEHPRGVVLFDTGLHRDLRFGKGRLGDGVFSSSGIEFPDGHELSAGIVAAGHSPVDITAAILSHLHFDHCGGTDELPNARLIVQRAEWKAGHHPKLVEIGLYNPLDFDIGHDAVLVEGVHDVFGDESVICLPTPGHTPGHQSLRVQTDTGAVVLTADCVYFRWMLDDMVVPTEAHDRERQRESMGFLARLRHEGCSLYFGHDMEQWETLGAVNSMSILPKADLSAPPLG